MGKRLCGRVGGGELSCAGDPYADLDLNSQWFNACSAGGANTYPYGDTFTASTCQVDTSQTVPVTQKLNCISSVTGYSGVYDLSGNVSEWIDSCDGKTGRWDYCIAVGGHFAASDSDSHRCADAVPFDREAAERTRGFRCCTDP